MPLSYNKDRSINVGSSISDGRLDVCISIGLDDVLVSGGDRAGGGDRGGGGDRRSPGGGSPPGLCWTRGLAQPLLLVLLMILLVLLLVLLRVVLLRVVLRVVLLRVVLRVVLLRVVLLVLLFLETRRFKRRVLLDFIYI